MFQSPWVRRGECRLFILPFLWILNQGFLVFTFGRSCDPKKEYMCYYNSVCYCLGSLHVYANLSAMCGVWGALDCRHIEQGDFVARIDLNINWKRVWTIRRNLLHRPYGNVNCNGDCRVGILAQIWDYIQAKILCMNQCGLMQNGTKMWLTNLHASVMMGQYFEHINLEETCTLCNV